LRSLVFSLLAAILVSLAYGGSAAMSKYGFGFLVEAEWNPVTEEFGALVPIVARSSPPSSRSSSAFR
jgi:phosphate transport system permease protein